jgi:hypothetical protein
MIYVGSYWPRTILSDSSTDFVVHDPGQVKMDGKHMYGKRRDGKDLKKEIAPANPREPGSLSFDTPVVTLSHTCSTAFHFAAANPSA